MVKYLFQIIGWIGFNVFCTLELRLIRLAKISGVTDTVSVISNLANKRGILDNKM